MSVERMARLVVCAQCDATSADARLMFRPIQLAESGYRLWACSTDCAEALETHLGMAYEKCQICDGLGQEATPQKCVTCRMCGGKGLITRAG